MSDDPFSLEETTRILREADLHLERTNSGLAELEKGQSKLIAYLHTLLNLVHQLEIERNTWKFCFEGMQLERNRWEHQAGELDLKLRATWRVMTELGMRTGEARCPECGSDQVQIIDGDYGTGVFAPDGAEEHHYQAGLHCGACGHKEEIVP